MLSRRPGSLGGGGEWLISVSALDEGVPTRPRISGAGHQQPRDRDRVAQRFGQNVAETITIAFVTTGDENMIAPWTKYAKALVGKSGRVFLAANVRDAAERVKTLDDRTVGRVFFVGHGVAAQGSKPGAFMLHGHHNERGGFVTNKYDELVDGSAQNPLLRALAPKLATSEEVLVSFLACYAGQGGLLQNKVSQTIVDRAPKVRVRVEGYAAFYEVKLDGSDARLTSKSTKPTEAVAPPKRPTLDAPSAARAGGAAAPDRTFRDLDSSDPLQGL
jgi:hypothetical protein